MNSIGESTYQTDQEAFWAGEFGTAYIQRNQSDNLLASNLNFFSRALSACEKLNSCIEFGANIGMNLRAMKLLYPDVAQHAIEINADAVEGLQSVVPRDQIFHQSILEFQSTGTWDLTFIKGVLIHLNPEHLPEVYDKLVASTKRYVLVAEYYNPSPVAISYRGHSEKLFKRDFAGEILDRHPQLSLIDYGFAYRRDKKFPQDDITWFLMEKR